MKKYEVVVTPEAEAGIIAAFHYIRQRSPVNAVKWLRALYGKIGMLERMPARCALAREDRYFDDVLRQLPFKSHRVIFRIEEAARTVRILYVRHSKRRTIGEPDEEQGS